MQAILELIIIAYVYKNLYIVIGLSTNDELRFFLNGFEPTVFGGAAGGGARSATFETQSEFIFVKSPLLKQGVFRKLQSWYNEVMAGLVNLVLRIPRNTEVTPEAAQTLLTALSGISSPSLLGRLMGKKPQALALEIVLKNQQIKFMISCEEELTSLVESQLRSNYPLAIMERVEDPIADQELTVTRLTLKKGNYYPIATYLNFTEVDPMGSVLAVLSKGDPEEVTMIQLALRAAGSGWQKAGMALAEQGGGKNEEGIYQPHPDQMMIKEKISYPGFLTSMRIATNSNKTQKELVAAMTTFNRSDGNSLGIMRRGLTETEKKNKERLWGRKVTDGVILNVRELASLWHLPSEKIKVPSILWGSSVLSEPPDNLPVAEGTNEEERQTINFFAKTEFKNKEVIFGIRDRDRLRHIWTVGKTGTGKSTMIENMVIDDFKKGRGVALIDPHGDSCESVLDFIPSKRINEVIYFNPADREFPITINPLEVTNKEEAELVVSGLMSIFTKVWANVWSARMEYILRNSFLTLTQIEGTTLPDVLKLMADKTYRTKILQKVDDTSLIEFWKGEFEQMPEDFQKEAIAPIQNKVGQFVTSPMIRRIIDKPKSAVSIREIMDGKKIFLANLSQGRLGEDNAALLGAMLITKFQVAAMRRVDTPKEKRVPYYLFVDEFQNFATSSFIKILSEARKYGLALILANQYMAQIPENVKDAIMGNAGTLISFGVGADDAAVLNREFAEVFSQNDLVNLRNFQIAIKLMIDWHSSRPFLANTLPLPASRNNNRGKVLRASRERWAKK